MKSKKLLVLGVTLVICIGISVLATGLIVSELKIPYNAEMYGDVYENRTWIKDEFYEENLTRDSWSSEEMEYVRGDAYPKYRTVIIRDNVEYSEIFKEFPINVDFDKTMILMHCFTTSSGSKYIIKSMDIDENIVRVRYKNPPSIGLGPHPPDASKPLTKWVIVVMDKMEIETAEFIYAP
ncbi:MAG: hypothetical protein GXY10_04380 [Clostridiales bacterium]|nr:hypothetical protein [Clostridiales bacterium]